MRASGGKKPKGKSKFQAGGVTSVKASCHCLLSPELEYRLWEAAGYADILVPLLHSLIYGLQAVGIVKSVNIGCVALCRTGQGMMSLCMLKSSIRSRHIIHM